VRTNANGSDPTEIDRELALLRAAVTAAGDLAYDWDLDADLIHWHGQVGSPFDCEYRVRQGNGEYCWVHERGSVVLDRQGKAQRLAGTLRVVTGRKQNEARLEYQANYDELTGHYNRARLREAIDHAIAYNRRYGVNGLYLTIGIDKLTVIADAFGYEATDAVITAVGQRLDRFMRASDVIGRVGGDQFGIVVANCAEDGIHAVVEKILEVVRRTPLETPQGRVHVTVSIGCVLFPDGSATAHDIMAKAEIALQDAKQAGRNCYSRYRQSEEQREGRRQNVATVEKVQKALNEDRLVFAFQPIVEAESREPAYYECLLRMLDGDGTVVPAGQFMPVVEQLGLIRQVDHYALDMAISELAANPDVSLAVNVSGLTASDRSGVRLLAARLRAGPDIAERLIVEITETVALRDFDESAHFVETVRELGCKVALDDFGAGYTSFRHLKALDVDIVKIDGSFVRDVASNIDNQLFIKTLLGLAQGLKLDTVAECVETAEEAEILSHHGVNYLQGWHFGRPTTERPWANARDSRRAPRVRLVAGTSLAG